CTAYIVDAVAGNCTVSLKTCPDTGTGYVPDLVVVDLRAFVVVTNEFGSLSLEQNTGTHVDNTVAEAADFVANNSVVCICKCVETFAVVACTVYRNSVADNNTRAVGAAVGANVIFVGIACRCDLLLGQRCSIAYIGTRSIVDKTVLDGVVGSTATD